MRPKGMPFAVSLLLAAIFCVPVGAYAAMASQTFHQGNYTIVSKMPTSDLNLRELRSFQNLKEAHPAITEALRKNPGLVQNSDFVRKHPALQHFLAKYPNAATQITANPGNFIAPVSQAP